MRIFWQIRANCPSPPWVRRRQRSKEPSITSHAMDGWWPTNSWFFKSTNKLAWSRWDLYTFLYYFFVYTISKFRFSLLTRMYNFIAVSHVNRYACADSKARTSLLIQWKPCQWHNFEFWRQISVLSFHYCGLLHCLAVRRAWCYLPVQRAWCCLPVCLRERQHESVVFACQLGSKLDLWKKCQNSKLCHWHGFHCISKLIWPLVRFFWRKKNN